MSAPLLEWLRGDDYTCPESMGCGAMKFCACSTMEDAADTIEELLAALERILDGGYVSEHIAEERADHELIVAAIAKARGAA